MFRRRVRAAILWVALLVQVVPAWAGWNFSGPPSPPNASIQTGKMTLELQCDRIRFAPAG